MKGKLEKVKTKSVVLHYVFNVTVSYTLYSFVQQAKRIVHRLHNLNVANCLWGKKKLVGVLCMSNGNQLNNGILNLSYYEHLQLWLPCLYFFNWTLWLWVLRLQLTLQNSDDERIDTNHVIPWKDNNLVSKLLTYNSAVKLYRKL